MSWFESEYSGSFSSHESIWIKFQISFWVVSRFESSLVKPMWVMSWVESKLSETEFNRINNFFESYPCLWLPCTRRASPVLGADSHVLDGAAERVGHEAVLDTLLAEAEVGQLDVAGRVQQDVLRLQVPGSQEHTQDVSQGLCGRLLSLCLPHHRTAAPASSSTMWTRTGTAIANVTSGARSAEQSSLLMLDKRLCH